AAPDEHSPCPCCGAQQQRFATVREARRRGAPSQDPHCEEAAQAAGEATVIHSTDYLELKPAPRAVFDALPARGDRPPFRPPTAAGRWEGVSGPRFPELTRARPLPPAARGLRPGARAAVYAANSVEWAAAALAIQAVGAVLVPVYPATTAEGLAYVLEHSDAEA